MSTLIQLRRASLTDIGDTNLTATVFAQGEPLAVYAGANTTPRLYIGDGSTDIDADLIGLGGPNSVTVDQIRGLGSTTPASNKFANTGSGTRVITIDSSGTAALAALDTSAITGTTLTMGGYDESSGTVRGVKLDAGSSAKIAVQRHGSDTGTDNALEVYKGAATTFVVDVDGDIEKCTNIDASGDIKADQIGAGSDADFASGTNIKGHFATGNSGLTPNANADDVFVESTGHTGISIASGSTSTGNIYFGKSGDDDVGGFIFQHHGTAASSSLQTRVAGATRATLTGAGNLTVTGKVTAEGFDAGENLINNVTDPSGAQDAATKQYVDRGASGVLSTFTPTFSTTTSITLNGSFNTLSCYRLGQMVTIMGHLKVQTGYSSGSSTGSVTITNLPFTCKSGNAYDVAVEQLLKVPSGSFDSMGVRIQDNTTIMSFDANRSRNTFAAANSGHANFRTGNELYFNISYITSDA